MEPIRAPLVGMHFRPPAKDVVNLLPGDTTVTLLREPDNPHDFFAVKVLLDGFTADGPPAISSIYVTCLEQVELLEQGVIPELPFARDSLTNPLHIGYIDAKKTGMAERISHLMDGEGVSEVQAKFTFNAEGKPVIEVTFEPTVSLHPSEVNEEELEAQDRHAKND